MKITASLCVLISILHLSYCLSDNKIVNARLESCPGCSLNRLSEVKSFAYDDLPKYDIEFKKIHGAPPELVFLNEAGEEVERHKLSGLNRKECNELLQKKGFKPKDNKEL